MNQKNNGGPAFPVPGLQQDEDFNGMMLRDYFAAKVAGGDAATSEGWGVHVRDDQIAQRAALYYRIADAMVAARNADTSHAQLVVALKDCVSVMDAELNGLAVIQPELRQAREALVAAGAA